jgi:hypothetical protein
MLGNLLSKGTAELVKNVGGVIDNLHTSAEEKLDAERKIKDMIMGYEAEMQKQVTERWKLDMNSDSWLSKNIWPLVLVFLVVATVLLIFIDAGVITFQVQDKWTDLLQLVLININNTVATTKNTKTNGHIFLLNHESLFMSNFHLSVTCFCISAS